MNTRKDAKHARLPRLNPETRMLLDVIRRDVDAYDPLNNMIHDAFMPTDTGGFNCDIWTFTADLTPWALGRYMELPGGEAGIFMLEAAIRAAGRVRWTHLAEHLRFYVVKPTRTWYADQPDNRWIDPVWRDLGLMK